MLPYRPIRMVGGAARSGSFRLELDEKSLARGRALLDRYRDQPLNVRMEKATLAAAKVLEAPMRQAAPRRTGRLSKSTRAQQVSQRIGWRQYAKSVNAQVGPTASHRHLVIRGHRIVTPGGRDTGRRSRANPYVDQVAARHYSRAIAEMRKHIFDAGYARLL